MRPLTRLLPKPLIRVGGVPMVLRQILALRRAGVTECALNLAHGADAIPEALGDGSRFGMNFFYSREGSCAEEALETRGGLALALDWLTDGGRQRCFIAVAGDIVTDYDYAALTAKGKVWMRDGTDTDAHLVLVPNPVYHVQGDMTLAADGTVMRSGVGERLTFSSLGLYSAAAFEGIAADRAPLFPWLWEKRLTGEKYEGPWANVGDPAELAAARERWCGDAADVVRRGLTAEEWTEVRRD